MTAPEKLTALRFFAKRYVVEVKGEGGEYRNTHWFERRARRELNAHMERLYQRHPKGIFLGQVFKTDMIGDPNEIVIRYESAHPVTDTS